MANKTLTVESMKNLGLRLNLLSEDYEGEYARFVEKYNARVEVAS